MKKIFFALLLIVSLISFKEAAAQQLKFYYYPNSNVYYDVTHRYYIYLNHGTWITVRTLPFRISTTRRVVVYNSGPEIWSQNIVHRRKYSHYPYGRAVGWKKRNPYRDRRNRY